MVHEPQIGNWLFAFLRHHCSAPTTLTLQAQKITMSSKQVTVKHLYGSMKLHRRQMTKCCMETSARLKHTSAAGHIYTSAYEETPSYCTCCQSTCHWPSATPDLIHSFMHKPKQPTGVLLFFLFSFKVQNVLQHIASFVLLSICTKGLISIPAYSWMCVWTITLSLTQIKKEQNISAVSTTWWILIEKKRLYCKKHWKIHNIFSF